MVKQIDGGKNQWRQLQKTMPPTHIHIVMYRV